MSIEDTLRNYRSVEKQSSGYGSSGSAPRANDPLAELARLIGQEDPFADLEKEAKKAEPVKAAPAQLVAPAAHSDWLSDDLNAAFDRSESSVRGFQIPRYEEPAPSAHSQYGYDPEPAHAPQRRASAYDSWSRDEADPYAAEPRGIAADRLAADRLAADRLAADRLAADRLAADRLASDRYASDRTASDRTASDPTAAGAERGYVTLGYGSHERLQAKQDERRPRRDLDEPREAAYADRAGAAYAQPQQNDAAYDAYGYDDGDYDDSMYDEEEAEAPRERRRAPLVAVAAVAGLAVIGTAGALAYWALPGGSSGGSAQAPVIKADGAPLKVAGAGQAGGEPQQKLIYDRLPDKNENERVVVREEQPLDVREATRSINAPAGNTNTLGNGLGTRGNEPNVPQLAGGVPPMGAAGPNAGSNEPKKVKTVRVRPDLAPANDANKQSSAADRRAANTGTVGSARANSRTGEAMSLAAREESEPAPREATPQRQRVASRGAAQQDEPAPERERPAAAGGFVVQVAAQKSENEAQASFKALQTKFPSVLGSRQPIIKRAELGKRGTYYRAQVGPFASADQANEFCSDLKSAGGQCIVQRN